MTLTPQRLAGSKLLTRQAAWKLAHPDAVEAHRAVQRAIRRGELVRLPCADCGAAETEAHHEHGYEKANWLRVIFLCRRHHSARHRRKISRGPK
jgi:hypothetical protein